MIEIVDLAVGIDDWGFCAANHRQSAIGNRQSPIGNRNRQLNKSTIPIANRPSQSSINNP
jgi:hypothetical protein